MPAAATAKFQALSRWFLFHFDWATLLLSGLAIIICLGAALGPWGRLRLGGAEARPEFSAYSWFSMLFAAGMGAGLVFWGVAEPLVFTVSPPPGTITPSTDEAVQQAFALTLFHWTFHAWALYAIVALAIGYMAYRRNVAPVPSAPFAFLPGWASKGINQVALVAVVFGIVSSLGQGGLQMASGLKLMSGGAISDGPTVQLAIILIMSVAFMISAWRGMKGGIEPLSMFNIVMACLLMAVVFIAGPTGDILKTLGLSAKAYAQSFFALSTDLRPEGEARDWTRAWSLTYFLWWIAWTPFVSVFIAKISRGRSIREFIAGVVLVPSIASWIWFSVFGGAGLSVQQSGIDLGISDFQTAQYAAYALLEHLPGAAILQGITLLVIFTFLVTSADSGSYVMALFSETVETPEPPRGERLFWGVILTTLTAGALASAEGQNATRALAVVGAIPLTILMVFQVASVMRQIWRDWRNS